MVRAITFFLIFMLSLPLVDQLSMQSQQTLPKVQLLKERMERQSPRQSLPSALKKRLSVRLPQKQEITFAKSEFLNAFKRQGGEGLFICLKTSEIKSPLILTARLSKTGVLGHPRQLSFQKLIILPPCLQSILEQMNFHRIAKELPKESIEIQWSLEF